MFMFIYRGDIPNIPIHITSNKTESDGGPTTAILRSMTDYLIGYATLPGICQAKFYFVVIINKITNRMFNSRCIIFTHFKFSIL